MPVAAPNLAFFNGLGGFSQNGKEYVTVLGEGQWTPAPWINVIANAGFGFHKHAAQPTTVINATVNGRKVPIYTYRPKTPPSLFAKRVAQGSTTYIPGTAVGIIDAIQGRIRGEKKTRQLKREGKLPAMVITERVKNFDLMDKRLEAELTRLRQ